MANSIPWPAGMLALVFLAQPVLAQDSKPAEPGVAAANQAVTSQLNFTDRQDFEDARRGFIATTPADPDRYGFLKSEAPATVNPSLWREAQLDSINGLFQVADGVYQVRDFSASSMTIVEGRTGIIVIDTLTAPGEAKAALDLYFAHRPQKPVKAVIYTHNHGDHYGGAGAVVSPADAASGKVKVIAPIGFMEALTEEASVATNLAGRRGQFQFGAFLPVGGQGTVGYGEGQNVTRGAPGAGPIIPPNDSIKTAFESRTIDGVRFEFQLALNTEAPSEMFVYLPSQHILDVSEVATHTLHNLLPIRGTLVRDAQNWSQSLNEALDLFGDVQILINQHQWPVWGAERARTALENHRDLYKYIHDQTIRMMNQGMTPGEIAEAITMPPGLERDWSLRGYYGTLQQDVRAVYQQYSGWYDGNPAHLNPLPPVEEAKKTIDYMGGADAVVARARADFKAGNYRWVASVMDQVVFADPSNTDARALAADAFEQMGYLAESAPWRNSYLLAAQELRQGVKAPVQSTPAIAPEVLHAMTAAQLFDYLGTRIDGPRAGTAHLVINWRFSDSKETLSSTVSTTLAHGALTALVGKTATDAGASVTTTRAAFERVVLGRESLADAIAGHDITVSGDAAALTGLWGLVVDFKTGFAMLSP